MYVIGTAGHVDHGKSTLVRALTGIDPDRLQEEKERGMTIDLGFAWLTLPSGRELSIVDVPGHERFIKNMLAGVGGVDLAMLVVAADESVMPQTREHLAILDLLRVRRGLVALTKKELVDQDWLELVQADVEETLKGTTLEGAPVVPVSAVTRDGLDQLARTMDDLLDQTEPRPDLGRPRLAIDRSFTIAGFGTVVTGTLIDGRLRVGQEVELVLASQRCRIRGLQTHRRKMEEAVPGSRVAVNLSGVSHEEIARGEVLATPGWLKPTTAVDVHLRLIPNAPRPMPHNFPVTFHTGASETTARVRLLDRDRLEPGEWGWAQLHLDGPVAVVRGDYFVVRSTETTMGGGSVVDAHARRHRRRHAPTLERLTVMEEGSADEVLLKTLESLEPCDLEALAKRANLSPEQARVVVQESAQNGRLVLLGGDAAGPGSLLYTARGWSSLRSRAQKELAEYHRQYPLRRGIPKEELRSRLGLSSQVFPPALARMAEEQVLIEKGAALALSQHEVRLPPAQRARMEEYVRALEANPFSPPTENAPEPDLVNLLVEEGRVTRASEGVVFATSAYQEMVSRIVQHLREHGKITVGEVRDMFGASRKYALPLLEHMDQRHITRRVGDDRVLR